MYQKVWIRIRQKNDVTLTWGDGIKALVHMRVSLKIQVTSFMDNLLDEQRIEVV